MSSMIVEWGIESGRTNTVVSVRWGILLVGGCEVGTESGMFSLIVVVHTQALISRSSPSTSCPWP